MFVLSGRGVETGSNTSATHSMTFPHIRLAQEGITRNEDWKPVIRQIDKMDWALVPVGCFRMGSTEFQLEEALNACKTYGGDNCPYVFDQVAQPDSQVCFEKPCCNLSGNAR